MFKSPFSFNGRIRRLEYGLSFIIYFFVALILEFLVVGAAGRGTSGGGASLLSLIILLPCLVFMIAQGVKRSHDLGNSGWFIFIPLYGFWLLFADSKPGINKYGINPKGIGNDPEFSFEQNNQY